ncbi:ubiquinol-cytochrome c reductase iron-sulfur subunit [Roseomonas sp. ACRSG]|nr:ubiquinol-cytochrome c reductase iron-sulfur subunit [Roseomonas sp. ACRSG]
MHSSRDPGRCCTCGGTTPLAEEEPAAASYSSKRRGLLSGSAGLIIAGLHGRAVAQEQSPAARARPEKGDRLVFVAGPKAGQPVQADDIKQGNPQVLAWAMEPKSGVIRNASRLNQVLLLRLQPSELQEETRERSADGVMAYSAICTHAQCAVTEWRQEKGVLHCPCHASEFDPFAAGKVVGGPALRPLPTLPLSLEGGFLVVAGRFTGRVGSSQG